MGDSLLPSNLPQRCHARRTRFIPSIWRFQRYPVTSACGLFRAIWPGQGTAHLRLRRICHRARPEGRISFQRKICPRRLDYIPNILFWGLIGSRSCLAGSRLSDSMVRALMVWPGEFLVRQKTWRTLFKNCFLNCGRHADLAGSESSRSSEGTKVGG